MIVKFISVGCKWNLWKLIVSRYMYDHFTMNCNCKNVQSIWEDHMPLSYVTCTLVNKTFQKTTKDCPNLQFLLRNGALSILISMHFYMWLALLSLAKNTPVDTFRCTMFLFSNSRANRCMLSQTLVDLITFDVGTTGAVPSCLAKLTRASLMNMTMWWRSAQYLCLHHSCFSGSIPSRLLPNNN